MEQRNFEDHKTLGGKGRLTNVRMAELTTWLVDTPTSYKVHCVLSGLGLITTCLSWVVLTVATLSVADNISAAVLSGSRELKQGRRCGEMSHPTVYLAVKRALIMLPELRN